MGYFTCINICGGGPVTFTQSLIEKVIMKLASFCHQITRTVPILRRIPLLVWRIDETNIFPE